MQNINFSICMPAARTTYLREAVEGVIHQTYPDWQLIIKHNGNKDVFDVLEGLDLSKITLIFNKDRGITDAINQAMRFATGDLLMWANDDDILLPNALETIANNIKDSQWGFGQIDANGNILGCECDLSGLAKGNLITQPSVFWRRELLSEVGYMNEDLDLVSDYEYWVRLMQHSKPIFINQVLAKYRIHKGQLTNTKSAEQSAQAEIVRRGIHVT